MAQVTQPKTPESKSEITPLEYASVGTDRRMRRRPRSGIVSFVAMVLQYLWLVAVALASWDIGQPGIGLTPTELDVCSAVAFVPTAISLVFGLYSVWVAGFRRRNIFGILALALVALEMIWISYGIFCQRLGF
jgi:uncharacterized protein (TIGR03382 family)